MKTVQISPVLKNLLDQLSTAASTIEDLLGRIKHQADAENLSLKDTRELVIQALKKRGLADRTIRKYTPESLKDTHAQELGRRGNSSRKRLPAADDAATVQKTNHLPAKLAPGVYLVTKHESGNEDIERFKPDDKYNADVTQELLDTQVKLKALEDGYQVSTLVEVAGQQLPVIVYVRPSAKSAKVVVDEIAYKEMYA